MSKNSNSAVHISSIALADCYSVRFHDILIIDGFLYSMKMTDTFKDMPIIDCECGKKILVIPDVQETAKCIENHARLHVENEIDPLKAQIRAREGARASTFGSLAVGLYNKENKLIHIYNVSSSLSQEMLDTLYDFFQKTKLEQQGKVTLVKPLLVCEVMFQSVTRDLSLRAPRLVRIRTDKKPNECTIDQLVGKCS